MFYKHPIKPTIPSLAVALLAVLGFSTSNAFAQFQAEYSFIDSGALRSFTLAQDEVYVQTPVPLGAGALRTQIESGVPGSTVLDSTDTHALVKLPHAFDSAKARKHTDELSVAFPNANLFPVLYVTGSPAGKSTRRIVTSKLLVKIPAGTSAAEVGAKVSATSVKESSEPGLFILTVPSAHDAFDALSVLRKAGYEVNPMLGHSWSVMALPKDRFFSNQWHLHNTGQQGSALGIDVNILDAWKVSLGAGITIAIVDSSLETNHPDLQANTPAVNSLLHYDFLDEDIDPNPHFGDNHGTSVAGVAAASQDNGSINPADNTLLGVSGSAPSARLLGLRLINEAGFVPVTDDEEATALYWKPQGNGIVDISNNSWGVTSSGAGLIGPDVLTRGALRDAVLLGRNGKGQVTLFAAGNGQPEGSESNLSGYANSRFVITVGAIDNLGSQSFYSEIGANVLVSAPSNGGTLGIVTTDTTDVGGYNPPFSGADLPDTNYTNSFGGTSSATPLTAGVCALMLGANPDLTWRDVKEILVTTASQVNSADTDWINNAAGFKFNHKYGGGMVDASAAVIRSLDWSRLPQEQDQNIQLPPNLFPQTIPDDRGAVGVTLPFNFSGPSFPNLRVETVEVTVHIAHERRSDLEVSLVSPDGTKSILANGGTAAEARRLGDDKDYSYRVFNAPKQDVGWTFTSTHHWGENSIGTWKVVVRDKFVNRTNYPVFNRTDNSVKIGKILSASVHVYGVPSTAQRLKFEQGQYTVTEPNNDGDGSPSLLKINVQRLGSPAGIAQVDFTTSVRGTATAAVNEAVNPDYAPIGGTITFGDGEISKEISIPIFHDTLAEEDEVIYLLLKNTRGASLGGINLASIRIRDNDNNNVTVTAPDATSTEPTQGVAANNATFVISRTVPSPTALVVNYALSGSAKLGTAQGEDFTLSPSSTVMTATIPPNETSTTITVLAREDGTIEGTETVDLTVLPEIGGAYAIGVPSTAQVRILDHDRPFVRITADQNLLKENDETRTVQLRIERYVNDASTVSSITAVPLVVDLSYAGTQINNQHYRDADTKLALPDKVVIPAGETAVTLNVEARQDSVYQALKSVVISFANTPTRDFDFGFPSSVNLTILEDDPLPDSVVPRVTLTEPKNNSRIVFPAEVTVSGAASDNGTISGIEYRINGSQWKAVDAENVTAINQPSTAWSFKLNLPESGDAEIRYGFNNLEVASVDNDGNRARLSSSTFKYVKEQKLNVALAGNGAVSIPVGESTREAGVSYTVSARPASGQVFKGWTGLVTSPSRTISFVMPPNDAALTAEFVASPFSSTVAGRYTGLVRGTTFSSDSSGYLDLNVTSGGLFSGKFLLPGLSYGFKGEFSGQGRFVGVIPRKNDLPFEVDLTIDLAADGTQRVTGTISSSNGILTVKADRAAFGRGTPAPAELVKNYTIILPPNDPLGNVQFDPQGNGYGTAKIDASGVVRANVTLGDGTKVVLAQPLNKNREWVFYSQPYQRKGVVLGIMTHSDQSDSDFNGKVDWFKPARSNDRIYPLGFTVKNNDVLGSLYEIPASGTVLDFATSAGKGEVSLLEGNIVNPIIKVVTLDSSNKLTIQTAGEDALNFNINARSGTFSGSFAHPVSSKRTPINGVIFQKQNIGVGTFTGSSIPGIEVRTGKILLEAFEPVGATISR